MRHVYLTRWEIAQKANISPAVVAHCVRTTIIKGRFRPPGNHKIQDVVGAPTWIRTKDLSVMSAQL